MSSEYCTKLELTCRAPQHLDFSQAKTAVSESKCDTLFFRSMRNIRAVTEPPADY